jgi:hypothetical protein
VSTPIRTDENDTVRIIVDERHTEAFGAVRVSDFQPTIGWTFAYNINTGLIATDTDGVNGGVTQVDNFAQLSTGAATDSHAQIQTRRGTRYIPGVGAMARFTAVFTGGVAGSTQYIGQIDDSDGWAFGYNGDEFGILKRSGGTDLWIPQARWNKDKRPDLDPTHGNVYQIEYRWLGFGAQYFAIEDGRGELTLVHVIEYSGRNTETSVANPNLPLTARAENTTNATDIVLKTPSAVAGLDGDNLNDAIALTLATDNLAVTAGAGVETPIISLRNPTTWLGKNNQLFVQALRLSFATDGTKSAIFRVYANATITGGTYADVATGLSPVEVNKTMTGISGGVQIGTYALARIDNISIDLTGATFKGYPGQGITITALSENATEATAGVAFRQFL